MSYAYLLLLAHNFKRLYLDRKTLILQVFQNLGLIIMYVPNLHKEEPNAPEHASVTKLQFQHP